MSSFRDRFLSIKKACLSILIAVLCCALVGCRDRIKPSALSIPQLQNTPVIGGKLAEVAPPSLIQQLHQTLEQYEPQVSISTPKSGQTFQETTVEVQLQVRDLPIFKSSELDSGPHLHFILDNEPYRDIYDISRSIRLEDLAPGTHTLRVFAIRPWGESFKNDGAYAQTTFHIFTQTSNNNPDSALPLLTYNVPQGTYGVQPILLDFYLSNAPLHLIARENPDDEISDWRIRVTVNGNSFLLDSWQPIYLKGLEKGENWVQLEFLDEKGNKIDNVFNNTVRVITYDPQYQNTLAQLVSGKLSPEVARSIVDPNYEVQAPTPEVTPTPVPTPLEETPVPITIPEVTPTPVPTPLKEETPVPITIPEIIPELEKIGEPAGVPQPKTESLPIIEATPMASQEIPVTSEGTVTEEEVSLPTPAKIIVVPSEEPSNGEGKEVNQPVETSIKIEVVGEAQPTPTPIPEIEVTSPAQKPVEIILKNEGTVTVPAQTTSETERTTTTIALPLSETPTLEIESSPKRESPTAKRPQWLENLLDRLKSIINSLFKQT